ncbi:MAG: ribonuclease H-like domain-containing protein [Spirochaetes bacterium]|nr:ribonuclease H-like domain-containing protein [Spirochaetota bacterium]
MQAQAVLDKLRLLYFSAHLDMELSSISDCVFFDLETTGLSGGAGTIAFLAALGRIENNSIVIRQYFLSDYPYESAFLQELCARLAEAKYLVTYNGRSYDYPLLRTRCIMNGLAPPPELPHIDLVYTARSLWRKHLPDCSLHTVEALILGIKRALDIPGHLIPGLWFNFLRTQDMAGLEAVFVHNADDIKSLAELFLFIGSALRDGRRLDTADRYGHARLLARIDPLAALHTLQEIEAINEKRTVRLLLWLYRRILPRQSYLQKRQELLYPQS